MTAFPKRGQWVRWITAEFGREGKVVDASWPSVTVKWLGIDEPQVFPLGYMYFDDAHPSAVMEFIERPPKAVRIRQSEGQGALSVRDAAAALKTTPRQIRIKLRAGKLKGHKQDGKWVGVYI